MLNGVGDNVMNEMRYRFAIAFVSKIRCDRAIHHTHNDSSRLFHLKFVYRKMNIQIEKEINACDSLRRCE